jgi:hypothetical protein
MKNPRHRQMDTTLRLQHQPKQLRSQSQLQRKARLTTILTQTKISPLRSQVLHQHKQNLQQSKKRQQRLKARALCLTVTMTIES